MKGKINNMKAVKITAKSGKTFDMVDVELTINYRAFTDQLKKYFESAGVSSKDAIGREVYITFGSRPYVGRDGREKIADEVRFINLIDEKGKPIMMTKSDDEADCPF